MWLLAVVSFFLHLLLIKYHDAIPCNWDMTKSDQERIEENCGYICPDPWDKDDPHYCGAPHPCCCAPDCKTADGAQTNFVGINWSDKYSKHAQSREQAFGTLLKDGFENIKLFSPDGLETIYNSFKDEIRIHLGLPNRELVKFATDLQYTEFYIRMNVLKYMSIIKTFIVGNEPLICIQTKDWIERGECESLNIPIKLLPALKNVKTVLQNLGFSEIPVTTAFNGGILEMSANPWTPCVSDYKEHIKPILREIWKFLGSQQPPGPFIVNIYSWFATMGGHIPPKLAVGYPDDTIPSDGQYQYYFNYDMQHDMQRLAMCRNDVTNLELWIGETGWPAGGHEKANLENAKNFYSNVVTRAKGGRLHDINEDNIRFKNVKYVVFLFQAFDELKKFEIEHGNIFENYFGVYTEEGSPKWQDHAGNLNLG